MEYLERTLPAMGTLRSRTLVHGKEVNPVLPPKTRTTLTGTTRTVPLIHRFTAKNITRKMSFQTVFLALVLSLSHFVSQAGGSGEGKSKITSQVTHYN
jgi:hypothetical protein